MVVLFIYLFIFVALLNLHNRCKTTSHWAATRRQIRGKHLPATCNFHIWKRNSNKFKMTKTSGKIEWWILELGIIKGKNKILLGHEFFSKSYDSTKKGIKFNETVIQHLKPSSLGVQLRIKRMILGPANHTISIYAQVQTWQHIPLQKRFKQGHRRHTKLRPRNTESSLDVPHLASAQQSSWQAIYNTSWWKIVYTLQQRWIIQPFSFWWCLQLESKCLIWWQLTSEALTLNWIQYENPLRNDFFSNQQLCNNVRSVGSNGALNRDDDNWIISIIMCVDVAGFVCKRGFNRVSRERDLRENKTSNKGFRGQLMEEI